MRACSAGRKEGRWHPAAAVGAWWLAVAVSACSGWSGSTDVTSASCPPGPELSYDEPTASGLSAADLMSEYGGIHHCTVVGADEAFWEALGLQPETESVPVELTFTYDDGVIVEEGCGTGLSVEVDVAVSVGDTLGSWAQSGELKGFPGMGAAVARLDTELEASGGAASGRLRLGALFSEEDSAVSLRSFDGESSLSAPCEVE